MTAPTSTIIFTQRIGKSKAMELKMGLFLTLHFLKRHYST